MTVESTPRYMVSNLGRIKNRHDHLLVQARSGGYMYVRLYTAGKMRSCAAHRLVATAFNHNPEPAERTEVHHINSVRDDNRSANLEWVTPSYNIRARSMPSPTPSWPKVTQYNLDGTTVKEWASAKEAGQSLHIAPRGVARCCNGVIPSYGGWKWRFVPLESHKEIPGEEWKPILVNGADSGCQVSTHGRVKQRTGYITYGFLNDRGYLVVTLRGIEPKRTYAVHRLVADAFVPRKEDRDAVNHKDGKKANNIALNIEWVTQSENCLHAYATGLTPRHKAGKRVRRFNDDGTHHDYPALPVPLSKQVSKVELLVLPPGATANPAEGIDGYISIVFPPPCNSSPEPRVVVLALARLTLLSTGTKPVSTTRGA